MNTSKTAIDAIIPESSIYPRPTLAHIAMIEKMGLTKDDYDHDDLLSLHFLFSITGKEMRKQLKNFEKFSAYIDDCHDNATFKDINDANDNVVKQIEKMYKTVLQFDEGGEKKRQSEQV